MNAIELSERLKDLGLHFTITTVREAALMFQVTVPGERWEIEVFEDGHVEMERFVVAGDVMQIEEAELEALLGKHADK